MKLIKNDHGRVKWVNPFKPEFTIVIFIHYKPLVVDEDDLIWLKN